MRRREFTLELSIADGGVIVHRSSVFADGPIVSVSAMTIHDGNPSRAMHMTEMMPWRDVEEIAAFVQGDGKDAQRVALADAILCGFQKPSAPLVYRGHLDATPRDE